MSQSGCSVDHSEPFALRVIGDSMAPEFEDGHIIIVDPGQPIYPNAFVVIDQDDEVFFGQYQCTDNSERLCYEDPAQSCIALNKNFVLKGVVTQRSTGRRRDLKHYQAPTQ